MTKRTDQDLKTSYSSLPAFDKKFELQALQHSDQLTKPQGSLGRLEDIAVWMCGWQRTLKPRDDKAYTLIFAGNHGVTKQGVSAFPPEVTVQMVANFANGGAAINQLCKAIPSTLRVIPLSLENPTQDFTVAPAMTAEECAEAFDMGVQSVPADADIVILGEMGIGNTTAAAAVACAVVGGSAHDWVGSGTGIDTDTLIRKRQVVDKAMALHRGKLNGALAILQHVGDFLLNHPSDDIDIATNAPPETVQALFSHTVPLGVAFGIIPVILDGYVVTAAAAALTQVHPDMLAHCLAGHKSVEIGHQRLLDALKMKPLLDLNMRLGEGSGAQLALAVVRAAVAAFTQMATFASAQVAGKDTAVADKVA